MGSVIVRFLVVASAVATAAACGPAATDDSGDMPPPPVEQPSKPQVNMSEPERDVTRSPSDQPPTLTFGGDEAAEITFGKYLFDMLSYAVRTGDVEPFTALAARGCDNRHGAADWISDI